MTLLEVTQVNHLPEINGGYIFNTPEFQSLKAGEHVNFVLKDEDKVVARIFFNIKEGKAVSGYKATFGSIDFNNSLSKEGINYFLEEVIRRLTSKEVKEIIIKHYPVIYNEDIGQALFTNLGFKLAEQNVNQHLLISADDFYYRIKKNEKKKLVQAQKMGFEFKILLPDDLEEIYHLIEETRKRKDYPVSMGYQELYDTINTMPDKYLLFGLFDKKKLIAASVSILISDNILYNFYHADDFSYRSTSPLVMLVGKIYEYCQHSSIVILDLGISSENGLINEGLFIFKRNLGCETSNKNTYRLINE